MRTPAFHFLLVIVLAAATSAAHAQPGAPRGRVVGRVVDASTGKGISDVALQVVNTPVRGVTGVDGQFMLAGVPAGTVALQVRRIGFTPKVVTGIVVTASAPAEQDVSLVPAATTLAASVVTARAERGTVAEATDQQRLAIGVVSAITAEQIAKSPDGDAAQTVQRVSGVTVQDSKYVFVRGLGERYTASALNGARVPSPEPERRVVPLDLFPSGLLQTVSTTKTFTPDQQGDFSGALVDIRTREYPARRTASLQLGTGYAEEATGRNLLAGPAAGGERWASVGHARDLPPVVAGVRDFTTVTLTQADVNRLVGAFRNAWTPQPTTGAPLLSGAASVGGNDPILFGHRVGYLLSASLSSSMEARDGQVRALADRGTARGTTVEMDRFVGKSTSQGVLWGGLANVSTYLGSGNRIAFNGLYNRSGDNDARVEDGEFTGDGVAARITRLQYVERSIYSGQVAAEHQLGQHHRVEWSATSSGVRRFEPDRSEFVQVLEQDQPGGPRIARWLTGGSGGAVRTFSDLNESSHEYSATYQWTAGAASAFIVKVGGLVRSTARDAQSLSYAISARGATAAQRELPPEQIFDGRFNTPASTLFTFGPLSQGGSYTARDDLAAGFLMADVALTPRVRLTGGARMERDRLGVRAASTLGAPVATDKRWDDLLPSLAVTIKLAGSQQLRLSASRTLARPEYRELSPIISRDVVGGENLRGDENLLRTNVTNADMRWEAYPSPGEALAVAVFAKRFTNPIERVYGSGSGGTSFVFYTNAQAADNYGVELEFRRDLDVFSRALAPFSAFANATLMYSEIHLAPNTQAAATNLRRRMVGQAPYVVNAGVTYASRSGRTTATLLFNKVGDRIVAAGSNPLPDVIQRSRDVADLSMRFAVSPSVMFRVDAKNLLDAPSTITQGSVTREWYRPGRVLQAGFAWKP